MAPNDPHSQFTDVVAVARTLIKGLCRICEQATDGHDWKTLCRECYRMAQARMEPVATGEHVSVFTDLFRRQNNAKT